jgi:hypothetical protein
VVLKAVEFDQYGDAMKTDPTGSWTSTNKPGENGVVDLSALTGDAPYAFEYTAGSYTATVNLTITEYNITWGELESNSLTYGEKLAIKDEDVESASKDGEKVEGATFGWENNADQPDAGTTKAVRVCYVDEKPVAKKQYSITVAKADQNLVIDGETIAAQMDDFSIDENVATELKTTVTNAKIDDLIAKGDTTLKALETGTTISYSIVGADTISVDEANDTITGTTSGDKATLKITAAGNSNYNEKTRTYAVSVVRLIHANIEFNPNDEDGVIYGNKITATITDAATQPGSLVGCTYNWGYYDVDDETGKATFVSFGKADEKQALNATDDDNDGIYTATVEYETTDADIDHTLAIQVITPSTKPDGYDYYDSITTAMKHAIIRTPNDADFSTIGTLEVVKTTKDSVIVNYIDGAEYAIVKKGAEAPDDTAYESNETYEEAKNSVVTIKDDDVVEDAKTDSSESGTNDDTIIPSDAD